jgi:hypothetical protein
MSRAAFILAHEDPAVRATFERHLPLWAALGAELFVLTPADRPLERTPFMRRHAPEMKIVQCGVSGYSGPAAVSRLQNQFQAIESRLADFNMVFEYDSVILPTEEALQWLSVAEKESGLHAFQVDWPDSPYPTKFFLHPPWLFDRWTFRPLARSLWAFPAGYSEGGGYADQIMALAAYNSGIPIHDTDCNFGGPAFTRNVIFGSDVPELLSAISKGVFIIHGSKTNSNELLLGLYAHGPVLH